MKDLIGVKKFIEKLNDMNFDYWTYVFCFFEIFENSSKRLDMQ